MSDVLLRAEREDYARLIAARWRRALRTVVICLLLAAAIEVFDYRLLLIALIVMTPSILAVADPVKLKQAAKTLGEYCEVRIEGDRVVINDEHSLRLAEIKLALSYPDAVVLVTGKDPKKPVGHPFPAVRGPNQEPLLAALRGRNVTVEVTGYMPVAGFAVAGLGMLGTVMLGVVGAVLAMAGVGFTLAPLIHHEWPDWRAAAYLGGAALALTLQALLAPLSVAALAIGQKNRS